MTTALKQSQTAPPATAQSVRAYGKTLALKLDALRAGAGQLVLDLARGKNGAQEALTDLYLKLKTLEFALEMNGRAVELARAADQAAVEEWRAAEQTMDPEAVIEGISKGGCCRRCTVGVHCVISAPDKNSGGSCGHPLLSRDQQFLDEFGRRHFRYEQNPRALEIYRSACRKLKVEP